MLASIFKSWIKTVIKQFCQHTSIKFSRTCNRILFNQKHKKLALILLAIAIIIINYQVDIYHFLTHNSFPLSTASSSSTIAACMHDF